MTRRSLVFVGAWTCRECCGLPYRTQAIGSLAAASEKLDQLRAKFGKGRPPGVHNSTYRAGLNELRKLEEKLGAERGWANRDQLYIVESEWINPPVEEGRTSEYVPIARAEAQEKRRRVTEFSPESLDGLAEPD